jgi:hypothetical protein
MSYRRCRVVAVAVLFVTSPSALRAQAAPRLEAGASAGGSAFGWQPHLGVGGELPLPALGRTHVSLHGGFAQFAASAAPRSQMIGGATLSTAPGNSGWWLGGEAVRRSGLKDLSERPRVSTGGWYRFGPLTMGITASRRSADWSAVTHSVRSIVSYVSHQDSLTGYWDSTRTVTSVTDSTRTRAARRWAETSGMLFWDARLWSAELSAGGRFASRNVPAGAWAGAELAVRLASPLALVLGGGTATGSGFLLDGEHRYVTLGFRVRSFASGGAETARTPPPAGALAAFDIDTIAPGRYRLSFGAPGAHKVELSGDFTGWKPVSLARDENGRWTVSLVLLPGAHRLNARLDGGPWIVPPGLLAMSDDFQGQVGVLVIEGDRGKAPE